jgi:hypothetical protein
MRSLNLIIPLAVATMFSPVLAQADDKSTTSKQAISKSCLLDDATRVDGVIPMYRKGSKLYAELTSHELSSEYIVLTSIARGIGKMPLLGGMTWGFEDDWIWCFRKVDDHIHVVRRNVRFRANDSTPEASAVENAYTDSVLFSLPILEKGPGGGEIVDLSHVFMSDLPQISHALPGFRFSPERSSYSDIKGFERNVEIEVAATYASDGRETLDTVADSRGVTVHVHYSISCLDSTGYKPRRADDRIGYFITAIKDFTDARDDDGFVRYINRWHLEKADPSAELSPPKKPIIFWIENTVPFKYRNAVREGILEWNKAFAAAGIEDAIEVRQQSAGADWAPEDINYNTFRWLTANAGFAMGPSRVNPYNGEILDADIIFDADFVSKWSERIETLTPERIEQMTGGPLDLEAYRRSQLNLSNRCSCQHCQHSHEMTQQMLLADAAVGLTASGKEADALRDKLVLQGVKEVVMHEVGHTLGLRHNFKASTFYDLESVNDPAKTSATGVTSSVMDYTPVNIVPAGVKQGEYFSSTVGPYDIWAIQYGYSDFRHSGVSEEKGLNQLAARSTEPGLAFATDEDCRGIDPDPYTNRYDLGDDPVAYAKQRDTLVKQLIPELAKQICEEGDCDGHARKRFNAILSNYGRAMHFAARTIGGVRISRDHHSKENAKPVNQPVSAKIQREAMAVLESGVFGKDTFDFPPELFAQMGSSHWGHWGTEVSDRPDYPLKETVLMFQDRILDQILSSLTLQRVADNELKTAADADALTTAELIENLSSSIFSEVAEPGKKKFSNRKPAITSLRRNLQRSMIGRLSKLALSSDPVTADAAAIAASQLRAVKAKADVYLKESANIDTYTRTHLEDVVFRIDQVLSSRQAAPYLTT